jgi:hypothetical protein
MSIPDLMAAIVTHPSPQHAMVSSTLYFELDIAGELAFHTQQFSTPSDPRFGAAVDRWLRANGFDPNAPADIVYAVLTRYPDIVVQQAVQFGRELPASGPRSFAVT